MWKSKKPSEIEGKEACFLYMMTSVALITLVFISRDIKKDDETKKVARTCSKTTDIRQKWAKILERNL